MNYRLETAESQSSKLEEDAVFSVSSGLGEAQVFLPRGHLFSGHTVGEESSSFSIGERGNHHDFVTRLREM